MNCSQAKSLFSPYLDGAVTGTQMSALHRHLDGCLECQQHYASLRDTQELLVRAGRRKAPPDLSLKLRVALSQQIAQTQRPYLDSLRMRVTNAFETLMVPVTVGLASAVAIFVLVMGFGAPLQAGTADVPLLLYTAPQLQPSAFNLSVDSINDDSLVVEAYVDSNGRIQDYRILSDSREAKDLPPKVKNMLVGFMTFTTFRPATSMGRPTPGRAVLSFSKVSVKG